jgi:hypothetical protein
MAKVSPIPSRASEGLARSEVAIERAELAPSSGASRRSRWLAVSRWLRYSPQWPSGQAPYLLMQLDEIVLDEAGGVYMARLSL